MEFLEALLLGIIQGLTEWLPVSSSGHLVVAQELLGMSADENLLFDLMVHLGTVLAVLAYFRRELYDITRAVLTRKATDPRNDELRLLGYMMILGTIPIAAVGLIVSNSVGDVFTARMVGAALIVNAIVLVAAERRASGAKRGSVKPKDAIVVGLFQAVSIIPGISRSGFSICGGLLMGIEKEAAATFAFLLSVPTLLGAFAYGAATLDAQDAATGAMVVGLVSAFLVGVVAIDFLLKAIRAGRLWIFGAYCMALGVVALAISA